ncbi:O-antigen ligase family protein [Aurantiacibacter poecillastricola]|uniref:O-antigen ligase family protein n=1 Tax=Aurantiacibacter poecillastricola TaxID=3064385 RepID=UPI00273E486E|nr:O-antigen ligase family protein [Aurantiacibacter sp. 219JJ12-13]MDP5260727.1 O-antigen ligase family protein [Aurantiacibacter sp. 219JJ12-13]
MNPVRTLLAFCATLVPATVIVVGHGLGRAEKRTLALTVVFACTAIFLFGAIQLSTSNSLGVLYEHVTLRPSILYGTLANRNSTAVLFVIALCLVAGFPWPNITVTRIALGAAALLLVLGTVLTQSRSGIALLALPLVLAIFRLAWTLRSGRNKGAPSMAREVWIGIAAIGVLAAAVAVSATQNGRAADSLARFETIADSDRPEMWEDATYTAGQYWPAGAGVGTFDDVFQLHESLEYVGPLRAGRAHSDLIELVIEGGILAIVLTAAWLAWCAYASLRPGSVENWWVRLGAGAGIAALFLQSALDYPLRNLSVLAVAAVLVVLLIPSKERRS